MTAAFSHEPSVDQLRREAERTRAGLTDTVEELRSRVADTAADIRERVSPAAIKAEVKEYVRESGEQFIHTLERKARENPLQAIAIGAGLAYPLFNILKSVPAPIMLIGAGILLGRPMKSANALAAKATTDAMTAAGDRARDAKDSMKRGADELGDAATRALHNAGDSVRSMAAPLVDKASDAIASVKESVTNVMASATTGVQDTGTSAYKAASDAWDTASGSAAQFGQNARSTIAETYARNPLLVAGIGLAIGAFIASSLPTSDAENRMFGETSDDLKERAERAAAQGVEAAKNLASDVSAAAAEQGVSIGGLASAAGDLTKKVRAVAESGLNAALGSESQSQKNSPSY